MSEWQLCPLCNGQGHIGKPPGIAGDQNEWISSSAIHTCRICNGSGMVLRPVAENVMAVKNLTLSEKTVVMRTMIENFEFLIIDSSMFNYAREIKNLKLENNKIQVVI